MKITELLNAKNRDPFGCPPVTVAFLGDSVTNGCFEVYPAQTERGEEGFDVIYDEKHSYSVMLCDLLAELYPHVTVNRINAGISGDSAPNGLARIHRDVTPFHPNLTVVCYGLNDQGRGEEGLSAYRDALTEIVRILKESGSEVILMTPQPIAARVHTQLRGEALRAMAKGLAENLSSGGYDKYMDAMRAVAREENVPLCDCYAKWKRMYACGVDITDLLANYLNHPTRSMHRLFAYALLDTIFSV